MKIFMNFWAPYPRLIGEFQHEGEDMKPQMASAILAALVISFTGQTAHARGPMDRGGKGGGPRQMMEQLDLTPEQRTKLDALRKASRDKISAVKDEMRQSQEKLTQALQSNTSTDELRKLHKKNQELKNKMSDARFDQVLAIRQVLTPEQQKKFQELRKGKGPMGRGRGGPGGRGMMRQDEDEDDQE